MREVCVCVCEGGSGKHARGEWKTHKGRERGGGSGKHVRERGRGWCVCVERESKYEGRKMNTEKLHDKIFVKIPARLP